LLENDLPIFHEGPVLFKVVSLAIAWAIRHWTRTSPELAPTAPKQAHDQFVQSTGWISPPMSGGIAIFRMTNGQRYDRQPTKHFGFVARLEPLEASSSQSTTLKGDANHSSSTEPDSTL
jgi:hypothetical protein